MTPIRSRRCWISRAILQSRVVNLSRRYSDHSRAHPQLCSIGEVRSSVGTSHVSIWRPGGACSPSPDRPTWSASATWIRGIGPPTWRAARASAVGAGDVERHGHPDLQTLSARLGIIRAGSAGRPAGFQKAPSGKLCCGQVWVWEFPPNLRNRRLIELVREVPEEAVVSLRGTP